MARGHRQIRGGHPYTETEIKRVLMCVVAWSGNVRAAIEQLKAEGDLEQVPTPITIREWMRGKHAVIYDQLRDEHLIAIERDLADRYRGVAAQAVEATELGVQVAVEQLKAGEDKDPSRSAANLATVADKALRDYSLLEGKPTSIQEQRGLADAMRALIDMGVLIPQAALPEKAQEAEPEMEESA